MCKRGTVSLGTHITLFVLRLTRRQSRGKRKSDVLRRITTGQTTAAGASFSYVSLHSHVEFAEKSKLCISCYSANASDTACAKVLTTANHKKPGTAATQTCTFFDLTFLFYNRWVAVFTWGTPQRHKNPHAWTRCMLHIQLLASILQHLYNI